MADILRNNWNLRTTFFYINFFNKILDMKLIFYYHFKQNQHNIPKKVASIPTRQICLRKKSHKK